VCRTVTLLKGDHSVTFSKGGALKDFLAWIDSKFVTNYEVTLKWIKQCDEDLKVVQLPVSLKAR
jgi:hypothetical protein